MNTQYIRYIEKKRNQIDGDKYPFCIPAIKHLNKLDFIKPVTFFVGENGTGKSTIIEAIATAYGFNPEGGSKNFNFSTRDTHSELYQHITLAKGVKTPKDSFFLRAESFYNLASNIDELHVSDYYGGESLHHQSHGEGFLSLLNNRLFGNGLYIFDEPEAALSVTSIMSMLSIIDGLVQKNSQFIIATHSPILISYPHAQIYEISDDSIAPTAYTNTQNYLLTKYYLNNYPRMLSELEIE